MIRERSMSVVPLIPIQNALSCRILERLNRFVVLIEVRKTRSRAHINNTGRLQEFLIEGREAFCFSTPGKGKTDFRLFAVEERRMGALIDTQFQMKAFERAWELNLLPWLRKCHFIRRNSKLGNSLIDYQFDCEGDRLYIEIKSAVLREGDFAMYPDCPSLRGQRHVEDLIDWVRGGGKAVVVFIAALPGVKAFKPNRSADPRIYELLVRAQKERVKIKALGLFYDPTDSQICMFSPNLRVAINAR